MFNNQLHVLIVLKQTKKYKIGKHKENKSKPPVILFSLILAFSTVPLESYKCYESYPSCPFYIQGGIEEWRGQQGGIGQGNIENKIKLIKKFKKVKPISALRQIKKKIIIGIKIKNQKRIRQIKIKYNLLYNNKIRLTVIINLFFFFFLRETTLAV